MTPEQKDMVQESFALLTPIANEAGALFYDRLFELDPSSRALFRGDIREQGQKLMQILAVAVHSLDNVESLVPALHALGRRHATYGVTESHFDTGAVALLSTLETGLGPTFTTPVREAWVAAYTLLATAIQAGMRAPVTA
jgi:nitric oxide dioxygenase